MLVAIPAAHVGFRLSRLGK